MPRLKDLVPPSPRLLLVGINPSLRSAAVGHHFVVPNPSGLNASFPGFAHKLVWYERLRQFTEELGSD